MNRIQLMNDGKRRWIVTIFWQGEDDKTPQTRDLLFADPSLRSLITYTPNAKQFP